MALRMVRLGHVDGFDENEAESESDDGDEAHPVFSQRNATRLKRLHDDWYPRIAWQIASLEQQLDVRRSADKARTAEAQKARAGNVAVGLAEAGPVNSELAGARLPDGPAQGVAGGLGAPG